MRSAFRFSFFSFLLLCLTAHAQQKTNPHTQIAWPSNCVGPNHVYNYPTNQCITTPDVSALVPGPPALCANGTGGALVQTGCTIPAPQVSWPGSCTTGVYSPASNTCVAPGTAANPAGTSGQSQMNNGGIFAPVAGSVSDPTYGWQTQGGSCYAKGFQNGGGNNGVANAMANCAAIKVDPSYTTDVANWGSGSFATRTPVGVFADHGDYVTEVFRNPTTNSAGTPQNPNRYGINAMIGRMTVCPYDMSPLGSSGNIRISCTYLQEFDLNPGWNYGAWQVMTPLSILHISSSAGTQENIYSSLHVHAAGDNANIYAYAYSQGGLPMSSAEGTKAMSLVAAEEANAFAGAITNGTNTPVNPTSITTTPNVAFFSSQLQYGLGTGRYLIPMGTCVSYPTNCPAPPFTGQMTGITTGLDNVASTIPIASATGGVIPASTAYGTINADINTPATGANVQPPTFATLMTFNVTIEGGVNGASSLFNTTDLACFDSSYHECARPTAVGTVSGGVQSVTMPLRRLHKRSQTGGTSHLYQGGMSGYCLTPQAYVNTINANQPLRYCFDVFGSRIITGTLTSVVNATGGAINYTGTNLTGICVAGGQVLITGFTNPGNNGSFICSSSTATTMSVFNPNAVAESGASGTATMQILQVGGFAYSNVIAASVFSVPITSYLNIDTGISSSGTTVTANLSAFNSNGFKINPGMSISIFNTTGAGMDGQCNNVQFVPGSSSNFTCSNPNLTGTHTNTSTNIRGYLVNTTCSGCNNTTGGQLITSYALRPMAEVTDVRNSPTATNFSIASNVLTVQAAPNTLAVGMQVFLSGFTVGTYLNNQYVTILSRSATQFTAAFTHADVGATADVGSIVPQPPAVDGTITLEPNILGTLANGSYVEEVHTPVSAVQGTQIAAVTYNPFSAGHSVYNAAAGGAGYSNGGYTSAGVALYSEGHNNPDNMYQAAGGLYTPPTMRSTNGAHFALLWANHFADGGATLAVQGAPTYQTGTPNFVAKIIDLQNRSGIANTLLTDTPYTGDTAYSTGGNATWGAVSHSFNGPVNNLTNDAGLVSGMAINYAPWSNQLSSWSNGAGGITCSITDDLGNKACTLTGAINVLQTLTGSPYTNMTQGAPYTVQARIKGNVGGESVTMSLNAQATTATGASTTFTVTNSWVNYCLPFVTFKTTTFGPNIVSTAGQTIFVSNVVVRPGPSCGPPILTTNNQVLTPTPVNRFPLNSGGASANAGLATLAAGTVTVTTTTACTAANSCVYSLTNCGVGGTQGMLSVGSVTAGTSFVINSSAGAADTSNVCWRIN